MKINIYCFFKITNFKFNSKIKIDQSKPKMIYLFQIVLIKIDILGSQTIFDTVLIMFFFIFTLLLLYSFRNLFIKQNDSLAKSI